jgi:hypothetical protein
VGADLEEETRWTERATRVEVGIVEHADAPREGPVELPEHGHVIHDL